MKKTTIIIFAMVLLVNILCGFLISSYEPFNIGFSSLIIVITGGLIYLLQSIKMKDAFVISLTFLFAFLGLVEFILSVISPNNVQDNGYIITTVVLLVAQAIILVICNLTSKKIS